MRLGQRTGWRMRPTGVLRLAPALTVAVFLGPVAAGMLGTLLPAFGYFPALGGAAFSLEPWRMLLADPAMPAALRLTAGTGLAATLISLGLSVAVFAWWHSHPRFGALQRLLSPFLAVPHAAVALGLAFLIAPSGWVLRLLSPWATGLARPPDLPLAPDPYGIALVAGLVMKELPFLLLMTLAALPQTRPAETLAVARSLGYAPAIAWLKAVLPRVYPQIRLPVYAVLAYSLSTVDMALVLAPTTPPPLAVLVLRWFSDPDLALRFQAAAGAALQTGLVAAAIAGWRLAEMAVALAAAAWTTGGRRGSGGSGIRFSIGAAAGTLIAAAAAGIVGMLLWSVARVWRWPDALPSRWTWDGWTAGFGEVALPFGNALTLGAASGLGALALALACLENEDRTGRRPGGGVLWLLYVPLLVPQIGFLFGVQVLLVATALDGSWLAVAWSHLLFVLPYVFLALADPFRAADPRFALVSRCLGAGPDATFWRVKLPMLGRAAAIALAIGFAVSVAQYLPTVFAGAGRVPTLTTEAVALAAGANRRVVGVHVVLQTALPLLAFAAAAAPFPRRRREGRS